jgi:hypothetical protein
MGDTYDSAVEAEADRAQQLALLAALNATERALRRDECGVWRFNGRNDGADGSIHTCGDRKSWVLYVRCRSMRHWTATKKRLPFAPSPRMETARVASGCSICPRPIRPPLFGMPWASGNGSSTTLTSSSAVEPR